MLEKIELQRTKFTFRNGESVYLNEPTLAMYQKANLKSNELEQAKSLLIDMSDGELSESFLNSLPVSEFTALAKCVSDFTLADEKN